MADDTTTQIPDIRTFQLDSNFVSELGDSVNLFRGDINLSQQLLSMPGRVKGDGLDVNVSLLYQSNVLRDAMTWNRDAPTSVVGLGWSMPATFIQLNDGTANTAGARTYSYVANGVPTPLAREPQTPFLLSMDGGLAPQLQDGQPVPAAVRAAFVALGINLSPNAIVQATSSTSWTIQDGDNQQLFNLQLSGGELEAYDGGESYQLFNYAFWKVLYYPLYERWVITSETGQRTSFGGIGSQNAVEWAVQWTTGSSVWTGPSEQISGQSRYARAWHLANATSVWGDSISYGYTAVEQLVGGTGGLPYTKACYLSSITDVFGRKAVFSYGPKLWSDANPTDAREYADPHKATPDDTPNAYQDRYETSFLQGIAVQDASGNPLFGVTLSYLPTANVSPFTGALAGDTAKRFLTGVTMTNAQGDTLPGLAFDYSFDAAGSGASPGALKTITYPQGAVATYTYTQQTLDVCDRTFAVAPPSSSFQGAVPRVYFGSDYAVVCWYSTANSLLSLQVYTWLGRWEGWSLTSDSIIASGNGGLDPTQLNAVTSDGFFALYFPRNQAVEVYAFQKDPARPGQWVPATIDQTTTAPNVPTRSYSTAKGQVTFQGGDVFLLAATMDQANQAYSYERLTWRWTTQAWTVESATLPNFTWTVANDEYHLFLDAKGNVSLWYLDPTLSWVGPITTSIPGFAFSDTGSVQLVPSDSFVVVSNLQVNSAPLLQYQLTFLQWNASYALPASPQQFTFQDAQEPSGQFQTSWVPQVVNDTFVGVSGNLLRYNGQTWLTNSNLALQSPQAGTQQRYAYGEDYAIQVLAGQGGPSTAAVLSFDPDADSSAWTRAAATPAQQLPSPAANADTANWPSAGGEDYLSIGQFLYFRGTATAWDGVVAQAPTDVQAAVNQAMKSTSDFQLDSESAISEGPSFQAYYVFDLADSSKDLAAAVVLKNGGVSGAPQTLTAERIFTPPDGGSTGPGQAPGGPSAFAAYPATDQDFDHASQVFLHRYAGDGVENPLIHYAVTGLSISNGYGEAMSTAYFPDPSQAACDPTGLVVKYFEATTYPGTLDATGASTPYGKKVTRYLNGLADVTGADFYNMLDGQLSEEDVSDAAGNLLSQTQHTWKVYVQRASDPKDGSQPPLNLRGGFVCQTAVTTMEDGVTATQTTSYVPDGFPAPYSGQPVSVTSDNTGGSGQAEAFAQVNTYAYQVNDGALALHMLTLPGQKSTTWTSGTNDAVPVKAKATTYVGSPSVYGPDVLVPGVEGSFDWLGGASSDFPFQSYAAGSTPAGWQCTTRTTGRDVSGQVIETVDACGAVQSTLYSADRSLPVTRVTNASLLGGAWAYLGFESYESTAGWTMTGTQAVEGDAHTGSSSLGLPNGAALSTRVTPPNEDQTYLLGYWYKTPAGFTPTSGAGFTVTVWVDGTAGTPLTSPFQDTGGAWAYATLGIPLTAGQSSLSIQVSAANSSAATVLVDDVMVVPLASQVIARAYDPSYRLTLSTLDSAGHTLRSVYDDFQRVTATVGPQERVKQLVQMFQSREGSASGAFDPASPNATLKVEPASGGTLETFTSGSEWQSRWLAGNPSSWSTSGGALIHSASTADTLTWQGALGGDTAALFFEVQPPAALGGPIGVTFGRGYQIAYAPSAGFSFTAPDQSTVQAPLASPPSLPRQWMVVFGDGPVLFFGDGQLIFSAPLKLADPGTVAISTGPNALSIRNLAMVADPRVTLTHQDATGGDRQAHKLWGSDARISAVIRDPLSRTVAVTRTAPASSGGTQPLLQYRSSFVDVSGFLANMADSWAMTGDLADYYPDDGGYPYFGYRFEASSRTRRIEQGQPGAAYAIKDIGSTQPSDRPTTQFAYGPNTGSDFSNLPAKDYRTVTVTTPVKTTAVTFNDALGRKVASMLQDSSSAVVGQGQAAATFTSGSSSAVTSLAKRQPNAFTTSPQSDPSDFVSSANQDPLGRLVQSVDPDTGTTLFAWDGCGRLRFVQPALDAGQQWFAYYKYDALGRVIEEGTVSQAWDAGKIPAWAAQPDWPDASAAPTVARTHAYDGDGSEPNAIGKEVEVITANPAPTSAPVAGAVKVVETYGYDGDGNLDEVTMEVSTTTGTTSGTLGYTYDNLKEITQVTYPDGARLPSVVYQYNDQGQVVLIGSKADTPDLAEYTYNPDGDLLSEVRSAGQLNGQYQYASPGWLTGFSLLLGDDTKPSFQLAYGYDLDGTIQTRTRTYAFGAVQQTQQVTYAYDGQLRMQSATVSGGGPGSEAITSYDANGNIWGVTQDSTTFAFTSAPGANQLGSMAVNGDSAASFTFAADGSLLQSPDLSFEYDPALKLTNGLSTRGMKPVQVQLAYGGKGQRVLRQASTDSAPQVYFRGASLQPLATYDGSAWTQYVQGPAGPVAVLTTASAYFPLQDQLHTVWAVVDDQNALVAQYDYYPFGLQRSATGSAADAVPLRFMGQELDAVTGLYDFSARLYHPVLRRFCSPDSKRQFASPYAFAGNNPLSLSDPTGNVSTWGRVGIGAGMAVLAGVGLALSIFSFGLSDMVTGIIEAIGFGAETAEAAGDAGGEVIAAGVESGSEGGNAAETSLSTRALNFGKSLLPRLDAMGGQVVSNTMFGIGSSGFQYDVTTPNNQWSGAGFRSAMISGTFSGILYGIGSGFLVQPEVEAWIKALSLGRRVLFKIGVNTVMGLVTNEVAQIMTNAATHQPWYQGWSTALIAGAVGGAVPFGMGDVLKNDSSELVAAGARGLTRAGEAAGAALDTASEALATARQNTYNFFNQYYQLLARDYEPIPD